MGVLGPAFWSISAARMGPRPHAAFRVQGLGFAGLGFGGLGFGVF